MKINRVGRRIDTWRISALLQKVLEEISFKSIFVHRFDKRDWTNAPLYTPSLTSHFSIASLFRSFLPLFLFMPFFFFSFYPLRHFLLFFVLFLCTFPSLFLIFPLFPFSLFSTQVSFFSSFFSYWDQCYLCLQWLYWRLNRYKHCSRENNTQMAIKLS